MPGDGLHRIFAHAREILQQLPHMLEVEPRIGREQFLGHRDAVGCHEWPQDKATDGSTIMTYRTDMVARTSEGRVELLFVVPQLSGSERRLLRAEAPARPRN